MKNFSLYLSNCIILLKKAWLEYIFTYLRDNGNGYYLSVSFSQKKILKHELYTIWAFPKSLMKIKNELLVVWTCSF